MGNTRRRCAIQCAVLSRSNGGLTIGGLARAAGVHVETIRYYQRLRLIAKPLRRLGAVHHYSDDALTRLRFIKRAQALGFSLREVGILVGLGRQEGCAGVRELLARKLSAVEADLARLEARRGALTSLVAECDAVGAAPNCPVLERLSARERLTP
jgi:MerR family mercuric resistance operon transcriptional regulator